jgi:wyosine [tRNA(Phe)-imidazoG37] synthetase (radical SAM superfamily)
MEAVFGPVPSRRLGQSLGIDLVPFKTCNWNCVYCQLGRTSPFTLERREYMPKTEILVQVQEALTAHAPGEIDWVTFVGSGEACLHSELGWLINAVKQETEIPVAVITNGSLLHLPEVRRALLAADAVMPSLDAVSERLYRKINRPHHSLTIEMLIDGLKTFRAEYQGQLWVEVMLIKGLNDSVPDLQALAVVLDEIGADEIHVILPTRPPAEPWVEPPDEVTLQHALLILGKRARLIDESTGMFNLSGERNLLDALLSILTRHPMSEGDLLSTLSNWIPDQESETLDKLRDDGRVQVVERRGQRFWSVAQAHYTEEMDKSPNMRLKGLMK